MARPELPLGTWGAIRTEKLGPQRFRARTRFRDYDGKSRDVEATDITRPAAVRALKVKLRDRSAPSDDEINRETRVGKLAELWLEEIVDEDRLAAQTIDRYTSSLNARILPAFGDLRIREATAGRIDRFLRKLAKSYPASAKGAKVVLSQMFALAVRHEALTANPVRETARMHKKNRRKPRALTPEHLDAVRAAIQDWQQPVAGKPGPRHTGDLADMVDLMLATGARIGEVLALRWQDFHLAAASPTVTVCGTLVFAKGKGFFRQDWTKSDAGYRTLVLPRFAVAMLLARGLDAADNPLDAVFPSRRGTWLSPNNMRRQWRQARADTELGWVVPHTFRKTVATLIHDEVGTSSAAAQLGHGSEDITETYYIAKPVLAPDSSGILERLGANEPADGAPRDGHRPGRAG